MSPYMLMTERSVGQIRDMTPIAPCGILMLTIRFKPL